MAGDAHYASVSLLLHGDGANGSTTVTDHSPTPKTVTAVGGAQISTAQSKYGGASMAFDGAGDYISIPNSTSFDFSSGGDFTIEFWFRLSAGLGTAQYLYDDESGTAYGILFHKSTADKLVFILMPSNAADKNNSANFVTLTGAGTVALNTWYHAAMVRNGTALTLYLNGTSDASGSISSGVGIHNPGLAKSIGARGFSAASYLNGYLDDFRVTKVARYTANFTPPTAALPDHAGEVAGTILDDTGAPCARTVRLIRRDTGALIGSATSDAGTGAYLLASPTLDEVQRIVLDDSAGTLYNDIIDRVIPA